MEPALPPLAGSANVEENQVLMDDRLSAGAAEYANSDAAPRGGSLEVAGLSDEAAPASSFTNQQR
jgi:hypothetical protein